MGHGNGVIGKQFSILAKGRSPFIRLRNHFYWKFKPDLVPTKRIICILVECVFESMRRFW